MMIVGSDGTQNHSPDQRRFPFTSRLGRDNAKYPATNPVEITATAPVQNVAYARTSAAGITTAPQIADTNTANPARNDSRPFTSHLPAAQRSTGRTRWHDESAGSQQHAPATRHEPSTAPGASPSPPPASLSGHPWVQPSRDPGGSCAGICPVTACCKDVTTPATRRTVSSTSSILSSDALAFSASMWAVAFQSSAYLRASANATSKNRSACSIRAA